MVSGDKYVGEELIIEIKVIAIFYYNEWDEYKLDKKISDHER